MLVAHLSNMTLHTRANYSLQNIVFRLVLEGKRRKQKTSKTETCKAKENELAWLLI